MAPRPRKKIRSLEIRCLVEESAILKPHCNSMPHTIIGAGAVQQGGLRLAGLTYGDLSGRVSIAARGIEA